MDEEIMPNLRACKEPQQPLNNVIIEDEGTKVGGWSTHWLFQSEVAKELALQWRTAFPIILTSLLLYSKSIISMLFLGRLGDTALAGGSLAIGFANITGYSVIKGLSMGMEPICGQSFGAKRWGMLSQTFQKTTALLLLATIPISVLWLNMDSILLWLGQDSAITATAKVYLTYSLPDLIAQAHLHPLRIFMRTQNLVKPLTVFASLALLLHVPINYMLVVHWNLGVKGVALAAAMNTINLNLGLVAYLLVSRKAIKPWSHASSFCLQEWKTLIAFAVPSAISVCLEWWWYELILILCGLLDNPKANVAAMGILIQMTALIYVFPSSLGMGLSTRVGHELGADQPERARRASIVGLTVAAVGGSLAFLFTLLVRHRWGMMFTCDPEILALTAVSLPIIGLCELGNCPQTVGCGILRGSARPALGANINFGSFYLVGLPVAVLAGFWLHFGFVGLWFGLLAAQASCAAMMLYSIARTDWNLQADRAQQLTKTAEEGEKDDDLEASLLK